MTYAIVLVEDPCTKPRFDLAAAVGRSRHAKLAVVVEAVPGEPAADGTVPSSDGAALAAACATTFGAPVVLGRFRVRQPGREASGTPAVHAGDALSAVVQRAGPKLLVIGSVSLLTLPLWEALHADPRTRAALKIGITSPQLDLNWNLAQKLFVDGKLHLHEHSLALERMLGPRIDTVLARHASRGVPGASGG